MTKNDFIEFCELFDLPCKDVNNYEIFQLMQFIEILNKLRKDLSFYQHFVCADNVSGGENA